MRGLRSAQLPSALEQQLLEQAGAAQLLPSTLRGTFTPLAHVASEVAAHEAEAKALMGVFTPEVEGEWVDSDDPAMRSFFAKLPAPSAAIANGSNVRASIGAANAVAELSFVAFVPSAGEPSESSLALTLSLASPAAGSQRRSSAKKARTSLSASKASSAKKSSAKAKKTPKAADDAEAAAAESLALDPDAFLESPYVELSEELQAMLEGTPADALVQSRVDRREPKEDGDEFFGSARKPMPAPDFEATAAAPKEEATEVVSTEAADDEAAPALDEATISEDFSTGRLWL